MSSHTGVKVVNNHNQTDKVGNDYDGPAWGIDLVALSLNEK